MQLQEIFLPCFSSLFFNVVKQSEWAVSTLMHSSSKASKHRRLNADHSHEKSDHNKNWNLSRPLQPILLRVESALTADAFEAGNRIRAEDKQRYNLILSPLTKFPQAKIAMNFPFHSALVNIVTDILCWWVELVYQINEIYSVVNSTTILR